MTFPTSPLPPEVIQALARGRKIEAIKHLRSRTGMGLAEAKALVEAHLRGERVSSFSEAHARHPSDDTGGHVFTPPNEGEQPRLQPLPPPPQNRSGLGQGEVRQSNTAAWVVAILVAVLIAYYFLFLGGS